MQTSDQEHYGTPVSYAVSGQDNEVTLTDYSGFVLAIKGLTRETEKKNLSQKRHFSYVCSGEKVVTDISANDGAWNFICVAWSNAQGEWMIFQNGRIQRLGRGLAKGKVVEGTLNSCKVLVGRCHVMDLGPRVLCGTFRTFN